MNDELLPDAAGVSTTAAAASWPAPSPRLGALGLAEDELVTCVACGLCLPHCPTFRVTGLEIASPRGRIAAMRAVEQGELPISSMFVRAMEECVQCRACETACPSSVPFGHLMEDTRASLARVRVARPRRSRRVVSWVGYRILLPRHRVLVASSWFVAFAQRLHLVPRRYGVPRIRFRSLRRLDIPVGKTRRGPMPRVWLFTGCVMDAWMRDTHRASADVLRAAGAQLVRPGSKGACCGALHAHAGRRVEARRLARRVMASTPGDAPIVVDSAGCGAAMKDYGRLLGTPEAYAFSARVRDFAEAVVEFGAPPLVRDDRELVVQDPCHLRNVQRTHGAVRTLLAPAYRLIDTDDDGLCCGAGGLYAVRQPELAGQIRARKVAALRAVSGDDDPIVASANPGCVMHLRAAGIDARHPAELIAERLAPRPAREPATAAVAPHDDLSPE